MSTSYFGLVRRLKDANVYARELAKQFALFRSVSDQVDNPRFKAFSRLKNYRLIFKENPTIAQAAATQYKPFVPSEGQPRPPPPEQPAVPPPPSVFPTKFVYPPTSITASTTASGFSPGNVNDNNPTTGWLSNPGFPHSLQFDLGASKQVHYVTIMWGRVPNEDYTMNFNVETSPDASSWTTRFTGAHFIPSSIINNIQTADLPNHDARYVRINMTSTTGTPTQAGIAEVGIWGLAAGSSPPPPMPPGSPPPPSSPLVDAKFSIPNSAIHETSEDPPDGSNVETNVNDGSLSTRWSHAGLPRTLQFDLGEVKRVAFLKVAWYRGNERTCGYRIETGAVVGGGMTIRKTGTSTGQTTGFETYDLVPDINARWVDFTVTSNSQSNFASVTEIEIWGGNVLSSTPPPPAPPGAPAPPPGSPTPPPSTPVPQGQLSMMLNFNNSISDESGMQNHALMDGGNPRYATGATSALGNSIDLNPLAGGSPPPSPPGSPPPPPPTPIPKTKRIKYWGAPVFNRYTPEVYNIWWGSAWNSGSTMDTRINLQNDMNAICNSQHFEGLWEYGWIKKPRVAANIVHTATALPSGSNVSWEVVPPLCRTLINTGVVPDPRQTAEPWSNGDNNYRMDYRRIIAVILPPGKQLIGMGGGALRSKVVDTGLPETWFWWFVINPPLARTDITMTSRQNCHQAWGHELLHCLCHNYGCDNLQQGYASADNCTGLQHQFTDGKCCSCGGQSPHPMYSPVSGTTSYNTGSVITERYWSDMFGGCAAPGVNGQWVKPPT